MLLDVAKAECGTAKKDKEELEKYVSLNIRRKVIELTNDNMKLLTSLKSIKEEVADKMNEATEIYNKALAMMKTNSENDNKSVKSGEKLDEYMINTLTVPLASAVLFIIQHLDTGEAKV